jgi:hypothetical protein
MKCMRTAVSASDSMFRLTSETLLRIRENTCERIEGSNDKYKLTADTLTVEKSLMAKRCSRFRQKAF